MAAEHDAQRGVKRETAAPWLVGFLATFVGVGLARFSFTPLAAAWVAAGTHSPKDVALIGAALLGGYMAGAFLAPHLGRRFGTRVVGRAALLVCSAVLLSEILPLGLGATALLRAFAGFASAVLMTLGASTALRGLQGAERARISSLTFFGLGSGALLSGALVGTLAATPMSASLVLGGVSSVAALLGVLVWPPTPSQEARSAAVSKSSAVIWLGLAYAAVAAGYVPHTLAYSSFVAHELGLGVRAGAAVWVAFGLGAAGGAFLAVPLRRLGRRASLPAALLGMAGAIVLPAFWITPAALLASAFLVGALVPGVVAVTAARAADVVPGAAFASVWGGLTGTFAIVQGLAGVALEPLTERLGGLSPLFVLGGLLVALGALAALAVQDVRPTKP